MRILLGLLNPNRGHVRVFGQDPTAHDALRARLGVLMENSGLDDRMTAIQSLSYHARLYGVADPASKIEHLLDFVGLSEQRDAKVGTFSTGMKRKLGLARSIVHDPEILFLDEPSAGLDPEAQLMVRELLQELAETGKITVFINSHHLDEVQRLCTRIAILHRGRIRANDTVANLRRADATQRLELRLGDEAQAQRAVELLTGPDAPGEVHSDGAGVVVVGNGMTTPQVVAALVGESLDIWEVSRPVKSLEDVYFEIMRDDGGEA
jgi:ABC-2 type transport system ATP-binding protein